MSFITRASLWCSSGTQSSSESQTSYNHDSKLSPSGCHLPLGAWTAALTRRKHDHWLWRTPDIHADQYLGKFIADCKAGVSPDSLEDKAHRHHPGTYSASNVTRDGLESGKLFISVYITSLTNLNRRSCDCVVKSGSNVYDSDLFWSHDSWKAWILSD